MTVQRMHAALAPIDILTREELDSSLHKQFSEQTRERLRGIDTARLPPILVTATGTGPIQLGAIGLSDGIAGPGEGDVWLLRRANVISSQFVTDTAQYVLFRGSTPSDVAGGYTNRNVLNGMTFNTTTSHLGNYQGVEYDAPNKGALFQPGEQLYAQVYNTTAGNTYLLQAEFIRCPAEMKGKLLG